MKMKIDNRKYLVLFITAFIIPLVLHFSFKPGSPSEQIHSRAVAEAKQLAKYIAELNNKAVGYSNGETSLEELRESLLQTRLSYKKVEFLLEYYYPISVKGGLNGAPLLHLDPYRPMPVVHEPEGLQRLDEIIFTDEALEAPEEIVALSRKLNIKYSAILKDFTNHPVLDREIFEAARLQVIRIFALGLTGFDTPGSANAIEEALSSMQALQQAIQPYLKLLPGNLSGQKQQTLGYFDNAIAYLEKHDDFEGFDRLEYLKKYINPLFEALLKLHLSLKLETIDEVTTLKQSWKYTSDNIFSTDFLNPYYYSKLTEDTDNEELRELGRMLFFDPVLSRNNERSCASCHKPEYGFTDGLDKPIAFDGTGKLQRHAPTVLNAIYSDRFFWDLRSFQIEDQVEHVIVSHEEFNTNYGKIFSKLNSSEEYQKRFTEAFPGFKGKEIINKNTLSAAIASYLISLGSFNSDFDRYVRGEIEDLDPQVKRGFNLFMGKAACGTCHFAPTFSGLVPPYFHENESEVLGILNKPNQPESGIDNDPGRIANKIPKEEIYFYEKSFKTVTVRNAELTAPYFHNGAYETLEEVVDFYDHGGAAGLGLDLPYQTLPPDSLHLSADEKEAIIAFMRSLTDTAGLTRLPLVLPSFENTPELNARKPGGTY